MNNPLTYPWQLAYLSAMLEFDPSKIDAKIGEALSSIEERLKLPLIYGGLEYQAIQDARSGITVLQAGVPAFA
jgi:hypothetical protein